MIYHVLYKIYHHNLDWELKQKLKIGVDPNDEYFGNASYVGSK